MVDKNILKLSLNDRLKEIDEFVDSFLPNTPIKNILTKYKYELDGYEYIESINIFSTLSLKGSIKYVSKYDGQLRSGGLLVKIYKKKNDKWTAIIKQNDKKYYVSFDANYIFYKKTKSEERIDLFKLFVADVDSGMYELT